LNTESADNERPLDGRRAPRRLPGRIANHSRQTSTIAIIAICNVVAVMNVIHPNVRKYATLCAAEATCAGRYWSSNMAIPFIDHSSGMWNPRRTDRFIRNVRSP
jgi:hypothetical protein